MLNPFFTPKAIEHSVDGTIYNFYPSRIYIIGQLKGFLKPLFRAVATLSATYDTDIGRESVETKGKDGEYQLRTSLQPINKDLADQRHRQREATVNGLVDEMTSPPAVRALGLLVMDSLRDQFSKKPSDKEIQEFVDNVSADTFVQMIKGVALANKEVFGPLTERVETALSTLKKKMAPVSDASDDLEQPSDSPEQPLPETPTNVSG